MRDHNSTGIWDAVAFYVVLCISVALVGYGMLHRNNFCADTTVRHCGHGATDGATPRPAHRAP